MYRWYICAHMCREYVVDAFCLCGVYMNHRGQMCVECCIVTFLVAEVKYPEIKGD